MNIEKVDADTVFNNMKNKQVLLDEFEKTRPNWRAFYFRFVVMILFVAFFPWLYPEAIQQPIPSVVLIVIFGIAGMLNWEIQRIDSRIDALYRLLKDDFNKMQ
jgi:hypothetical protein